MKKVIGMFLMMAVVIVMSGCDETAPVDTTDTQTTTDTKQLFPSDFEDACNGVMVAGAAEYDATAEGVHPIYVFEFDDSKYYERSTILPEAWQKPWEEAKDTELVVCLKVAEESLNKTCDFEDEGEALKLELYDALFEVTLYEAATGAEVVTTEFDLTHDDCPMMYFFSDDTEKDYPDYTQDLTDFVKEYVQVSA